jgi:hypothetical protein
MGKHFSNDFPLQSGIKEVDVLLPLCFNIPLVYVIRKIYVKWEGVKLNGANHLLLYAILGDNTYTISMV